MPSLDEYDYVMKILIIGDSGTGKSSLLMRYADGTFPSSYISTIGVDFKIRTTDVNGKVIKLMMWDTAGQEKFKTITTSYYRGANAIIIVYDVSDLDTFQNLNSWIHDVETHCSQDVLLVIAGNKCDLVKERCVSKEQAEEFTRKIGCEHIEVSAKIGGENVDKLFNSLATKFQVIRAEAELGSKRDTKDTGKATYDGKSITHNRFSSCCN